MKTITFTDLTISEQLTSSRVLYYRKQLAITIKAIRYKNKRQVKIFEADQETIKRLEKALIYFRREDNRYKRDYPQPIYKLQGTCDKIRKIIKKLESNQNYITKVISFSKYQKDLIPFNIDNNTKLNGKNGKSLIAVLNIGTAIDCISKDLGLCKIVNSGIRCYAEKAEKIYKASYIKRLRQSLYFSTNTADKIASDFKKQFKNRKVKSLRINESGDIHGISDIKKLDRIAEILQADSIKSYTYTARKDLSKELSKVKYLTINTSNFTIDNTNSFKAMPENTIIEIESNLRAINKNNKLTGKKLIVVCPSDCSICSLCKKNRNLDILVKIH